MTGPAVAHLGTIRWRRAAAAARSVAASLAVPVSTALVSLLVVRVSGVETWGAFVAVLLVVQLGGQVLDWGSRDALLRAFARSPASIAAAWQTSLVTRTLLVPLAIMAFVVVTPSPDRLAWMSVWLVAIVVARAHEALVAYHRAFGVALIVELMVSGAMLVAIVWLGERLSVDGLVALFTLGAVARAVLLSARFRTLSITDWTGRVDPGLFRRTWPFFALTFSGALGSRIDLYVVAALLPATALGQYQVLTGMVLLIQALSASLLAPVVPSLYRVARPAIRRAAGRLVLVAVVITPLAMIAAAVALVALYGIELPVWVIAVAWLTTLPVFGYLPLVHRAYRDGRERLVLVANVASIAVTAVATVILAGPLGIGGAMVAAFLGQVTVATWLVLAERRAVDEPPARDGATLPHALPGM